MVLLLNVESFDEGSRAPGRVATSLRVLRSLTICAATSVHWVAYSLMMKPALRSSARKRLRDHLLSILAPLQITSYIRCLAGYLGLLQIAIIGTFPG